MGNVWVIDGTIMQSVKNETLEYSPRTIMGMAVSATAPIIMYATSLLPMEDFTGYCVSHGIVPTNGRKNALNILCGTNRMIYHVTYRNDDGIATRIYLLHNLLRDNNARSLQESYGGKTPIESALLALKACERIGVTGMTIGGAAMRDYIEMGRGYGWFNKTFPDIGIKDERKMRTGYLGGYIMAQAGDYENIIDYDNNSLYPYVMKTKHLPYGEPVSYNGKYINDDDMPLHIDLMTFRADLKPNGMAFLGIYDGLTDSRDNRVTSTRGYVTIALTNVDQELLFENYDVSVYEYVQGWKFRASRDLFREYVDRWYTLKRNAKGAKRSISKLMLVSLGGKFGTIPRDTTLLPYWDDPTDSLMWRIAPSDSSIQSRHYLPVAMYVTAYGRRILWNAMRSHWDHVIQANTDGFMTDMPIDDIEISDTKLGAWKREAEYRRLRIIDSTLYQGERKRGRIDLVCAGISRSAPIPWEQFRVGGTFVDDYGTDIVIQ